MEPEVTDWSAVIFTVNFVVFSALMVAAAALTTHRWIRYYRYQQRPPVLLIRDMLARFFLATPFAAFVILNLVELWGVDMTGVRHNAWWRIGVTSSGVFGAAVYVYYELFVIERIRADLDEDDPFSAPFGDL